MRTLLMMDLKHLYSFKNFRLESIEKSPMTSGIDFQKVQMKTAYRKKLKYCLRKNP